MLPRSAPQSQLPEPGLLWAVRAISSFGQVEFTSGRHPQTIHLGTVFNPNFSAAL